MALLNETTLQLKIQKLELALRSVGGLEDGKFQSIRGVPNSTDNTGEEGDLIFNVLNAQMYSYENGSWVAVGNYTWIRYADDILDTYGPNNDPCFIDAAPGVLQDSSCAIEDSEHIRIGTTWIGEAFNKNTSSASSNVTDYIWRLAPAGIDEIIALLSNSAPPPAPEWGDPSSFEEFYFTNQAGGIKSRVKINFTIPNSNVDESTGVAVRVEFSLDGDVWETLITTPENYAYLNDVIIGTCSMAPSTNNTKSLCLGNGGDWENNSYWFRIYSISNMGIETRNTSESIVLVTGVDANPSAPTGVRISSSGSNALLTWDQSQELDVRAGGTVEIKHSNQVPGSANWDSSSFVVPSLSGVTSSKTVPLIKGTYLIRFVDQMGNYSTSATVGNSFQPSNFNLVDEVVEGVSASSGGYNPVDNFGGTKVGCTIDTGPGGNPLILDVGESDMTYYFEDSIDLLIEKSARVVPTYEAYITMRSGSTICDIGSGDDTRIVRDLDPVCAPSLPALTGLYISISKLSPSLADSGTDYYVAEDDIPSGSEIGDVIDPDYSTGWTEWDPLLIGNYTSRSLRFKFEGSTTVNGVTNTSIKMTLAKLKVSIDTEDVVKTGSVTTISTGATQVLYSSADGNVAGDWSGFYSGVSTDTVPRIGTQVTGGPDANGGFPSTYTGGDTVVVRNITSTKFDIEVWDSNEQRAVRIIDWQAIGQ